MGFVIQNKGKFSIQMGQLFFRSNRKTIFPLLSHRRHHAPRPCAPCQARWSAHEPDAQQADLPLSDGVHLRHPSGIPGLQRRLPARFPALGRNRDALSGRRHHRRLESAQVVLLAAGLQRRHPHHPRQGEARHARRLHSGQPRQPVPRLRRHGVRQRRDPPRGDPRDGRRPPPAGPARRRVRRSPRISSTR